MPEFHLDTSGRVETKSERIPFSALDEFTQGYIEAMFFTDSAPHVSTEEWQEVEAANEEHPEGSFPCDVGYSDLAPESLAKIMADCEAFQVANAELLDAAYCFESAAFRYDQAAAGRDFWYTRNGHGVGYWDRGLGDVGDKLSEKCGWRSGWFKEVWTYLGDDGKVYVS